MFLKKGNEVAGDSTHNEELRDLAGDIEEEEQLTQAQFEATLDPDDDKTLEYNNKGWVDKLHTWWNATYDMLKFAYWYKKVINKITNMHNLLSVSPFLLISF